MNPLDEHFALWLARVEELLGHPTNPWAARNAFECYEAPTAPLSPEEYVAELQRPIRAV